jgi:malate dehydrogenase (oxaloacetate-decarboxylating)(NADP+)
VRYLGPSFGGINLEDIKAPECFQIEETLKKTLQIPVFHDDQHGTAIISGAALLNALELVGKKINEVKVVVNGAGASGIACAKYYLGLGVNPKNLTLCDSVGVIFKGRSKGMNSYKEQFAVETEARTLAEAVRGADVLAGLSVANVFTKEMLKSLADRPVIFAMANPDPEIPFEEAKAARPDAIIATGRSDYPNQVNNVLGFPFIFRGALDVRAIAINEEMKRAATHALASLAREDVPESVTRAYGVKRLEFGTDYLIPKPFDHRVLLWEAAAVAKAAMDTGAAHVKVDLDEYREQLEMRLGKSREVMRVVINQARRKPKRVVYPEGHNEKVLRASQIILDEGLAQPILLGNKDRIAAMAKELQLDLSGAEIIRPSQSDKLESYAVALAQVRQRKGVTLDEARVMLVNPTRFGAMMVRRGDADALVAGASQNYPETIRPALEIVGVAEDVAKVAGLYMMILKQRIFFFADTTVNIEPTAQDLADIAIMTAKVARRFQIEPRIAMLSFSNFGSVKHPFVTKVQEAARIVKQRAPELMVDGEMQADTAVVPELIEEQYPFSSLKGGANVLIFPDLQSANIAYKLVQKIGGAEAIGPILVGMKRPVHVLHNGCDVNDIVNMTAIAVVDAQHAEEAGNQRP